MAHISMTRRRVVMKIDFMRMTPVPSQAIPADEGFLGLLIELPPGRVKREAVAAADPARLDETGPAVRGIFYKASLAL